ncbi:NAD(P)H-dependent glycerol-3-phosphate dehydrogenase [Acidaminobacter hydrogenoformans]|uniref:Glycerol-3-phosphate dehydrogenase [NAD(P)+] n=1 Tax=Acidaminobacter hydrogenoformans DSM 2784 TaxID=1120920 RepID=A0A1G5RSE8_9FIRM|nr:NAD(P)H-dependent glycerol-3-phosphate dehydrogenase [Acidaminobacter hydrogenoformans]SCZ77002.1 glycerol 3-phosphate dehydrogenase (NAD(P)+) [Acidaminobacter hydrogenoformans DSM 2784]
MKIAVLGTGSWGTALVKVLLDNGHQAAFWGRDPQQTEVIEKTRHNAKYLKGVELAGDLEVTSDLDSAVLGAKVIVLAVASQAIRSLLSQLNAALISEDVVFVNVSKGIELGTHQRISEIVHSFFPKHKYVVLSGPSHAEEVSAGIPTTLVSSSASRGAAELIQDVFSNESLRVYTNPDVIGVELGGALKNIIALGAGISDGLGFGDNSKAALMTRGIAEIARLGRSLGASSATFQGLSGIGDLIVTCTSLHSRNRRFGMLIGQGVPVEAALKEIDMVVEGYYTIHSAYELSQIKGVEMPITRELFRVLYEGEGARESVKRLMLRGKKHELEEAAEALKIWDLAE